MVPFYVLKIKVGYNNVDKIIQKQNSGEDVKKATKFKIYSTLLLLIANTICAFTVNIYNLESTSLKIIGSYFAIFLTSVATYKLPLKIYNLIAIFVFFSSSLGSCVNLYYYIDGYDTIIHFLSGIVIAAGAKYLFKNIFKKSSIINAENIITLLSLTFSCSAAAFWEIYEYFIDVTLNANMQGTKANTMNDIIAGVTGAIVITLIEYICTKVEKQNETSI